MLPPEAIQEFKDLWHKEFGEDIDDDLAREKATNLIELFAVISRAPADENHHEHATDEQSV